MASLQDRTELAQALNIARTQLARRRGQLGELTREQELAIENLMMSTTAKIAGLIGQVQLVIAGNAMSDLEWTKTIGESHANQKR